MAYEASFKGRAERELVELARSLSGLSQGAYTRAVLLKEAYSVVRRAQELQAQENKNERTTETPPDNSISGETPRESLGSNLVAEPQTADNQA